MKMTILILPVSLLFLFAGPAFAQLTDQTSASLAPPVAVGCASDTDIKCGAATASGDCPVAEAPACACGQTCSYATWSCDPQPATWITIYTLPTNYATYKNTSTCVGRRQPTAGFAAIKTLTSNPAIVAAVPEAGLKDTPAGNIPVQTIPFQAQFVSYECVQHNVSFAGACPTPTPSPTPSGSCPTNYTYKIEYPSGPKNPQSVLVFTTEADPKQTCMLETTPNGGSSGTCKVGYAGSGSDQCKYNCVNGTWVPVANVCIEDVSRNNK